MIEAKTRLAAVTEPSVARPTGGQGIERYPARLLWVALAAALAALAWAFWPVIRELVKEWRNNDDYSVGQLVPLAALYLLWHDRARIRQCHLRPCWLGLGLLLAAQVGRFYGLLFLFESAERYALVLAVWGVVLLVAGRPVFRRAGWVMLFLLLMMPLPGRVHNLISGPLQGMATAGAVFMLELVGVTVSNTGNVIRLNHDIELAVAEACSGLRMLTAFIVVAAAMAYLANRPRWQKGVLLLSSIPVAIICNLVRLFVTALLYLVNAAFAEKFFHDFAGLVMMPLAVFILFGELWLMNRLVIPDRQAAERPRRGGPAER